MANAESAETLEPEENDMNPEGAGKTEAEESPLNFLGAIRENAGKMTKIFALTGYLLSAAREGHAMPMHKDAEVYSIPGNNEKQALPESGDVPVVEYSKEAVARRDRVIKKFALTELEDIASRLEESKKNIRDADVELSEVFYERMLRERESVVSIEEGILKVKKELMQAQDGAENLIPETRDLLDDALEKVDELLVSGTNAQESVKSMAEIAKKGSGSNGLGITNEDVRRCLTDVLEGELKFVREIQVWFFSDLAPLVERLEKELPLRQRENNEDSENRPGNWPSDLKDLDELENYKGVTFG